MDDLWPESIGQTSDSLTPITILQEQAKLLGDKTQNIVTADVETVIDNEKRKPFVYGFYVVAPVLQNFRYRLLEVSHNIELYPLSIYVDEEIINENEGWNDIEQENSWSKKYFKAKDESEFIDLLKIIFSSNKTKRIIANLMSQSKQLGGYAAPTEDDVTF